MFFLAGFLTDFPPFRHIRYCGHNHRERMKQMKKMCFRIAALALLAVVLAGSAFAAQVLVPVGQAVGLALETDGLTVYFSAALGSTPCHILSGTMNMAYLSPIFALNFGEKVISSSIYTEGSWP